MQNMSQSEVDEACACRGGGGGEARLPGVGRGESSQWGNLAEILHLPFVLTYRPPLSYAIRYQRGGARTAVPLRRLRKEGT